MATTHEYHQPVVEHHVHDTEGDSSALMIVLLVAAVLIVGFLLFVMRAFPFSAVGSASDRDIDVNLPSVETPNVNVEQQQTAPGSTQTPATDY